MGLLEYIAGFVVLCLTLILVGAAIYLTRKVD